MSTTASKLDGLTFPSGDDVGALVVDLGSLYVQAGFAGDEWPKHFSESLIGDNFSQPAEPSQDLDMATEEPYRKKQRRPSHKHPLLFSVLRDNTEVRSCLYRPSKRVIDKPFPTLDEVLMQPEPLELDRDAFETIIDRIYNDEEGLNVTVEGRPVLITEPNKKNRRLREGLAEVLFETFRAEGVYTAKKSVLTAFSVGRTGGLIVDMGASSTTLTPVFDGYALQKNVKELPIGGDLLDYQLSYLLKEMKLDPSVVPLYSVKKKIKIAPNLPPALESIDLVQHPQCHPTYYRASQRSVLRSMKESICRLSDDPLPNSLLPIVLSALSKNSTTGGGLSKYELPDGTIVNTDQLSRSIPECLLNFQWIFGLHQDGPIPATLLGASGLVNAVSLCLLECDVDCRRDLLSALTFSGGCSLLPGFNDRITRQFQDVETSFGNSLKYKIICPNSPIEKRFSSWIGGSILASLGSFQQMWMARSEYEEHGVSLLDRRCVQ